MELLEALELKDPMLTVSLTATYRGRGARLVLPGQAKEDRCPIAKDESYGMATALDTS